MENGKRYQNYVRDHNVFNVLSGTFVCYEYSRMQKFYKVPQESRIFCKCCNQIRLHKTTKVQKLTTK